MNKTSQSLLKCAVVALSKIREGYFLMADESTVPYSRD